MSLPQDTTTIEELIRSGTAITDKYDTYSFLEKIQNNGTIVSIQNVIWDYLFEAKNASVLVELSNEEYRKYKFKPKLLCYDIYGNPELFFVILALNDIADVTEFNLKKIRMLKRNHMQTFLSLVYNAEKAAIKNYNKV